MTMVPPYRVLNTYDPFLVFEQELPRLRFNMRAPTPTAGQALVLVGGPEIIVVRPGERVPNWFVGNYRYLYKVDVGEHPLDVEGRLPAHDGAFVFQAHLSYTAFVRDPAQVAMSRTRNVAATVVPYLMQIMRDCSLDFDPGDVGPAERKINTALAAATGEGGVGVHRCLAQLTIDSDEGAGVRAHRITLMEMQNREMRFRQYETFLRDGDTKLLTLHLAEHPDDAGALYSMLRDQEGEESDRFLQTLKVVLNSAGDDEDFELDEGRRRMVRSLFDKADPSGMSPIRRISASRVRGTLGPAPAEPDRPATVEGEARPGKPAAARPADGRPADGRRADGTPSAPKPTSDKGPSRVVRPMRDPDAD